MSKRKNEFKYSFYCYEDGNVTSVEAKGLKDEDLRFILDSAIRATRIIFVILRQVLSRKEMGRLIRTLTETIQDAARGGDE